MTHDPLCPCHQQPNPASHWHDDGAACCECDLISTVRVNESAAYWRKAPDDPTAEVRERPHLEPRRDRREDGDHPGAAMTAVDVAWFVILAVCLVAIALGLRG